MRTLTQLKVFFAAVLIALATLTTMSGPAQVMGAEQSDRVAARPSQKGSVSSRAAASGGSLSFLPAVAYDSGGDSVRSVGVADVNGDGKPDLVVANICAKTSSSNCAHGLVNGSVGILLGKGDGTFQPVVTYTSTGLQALAVAVADVN